MKSIILYYSRAAENYFHGALRYVEEGNTKRAAEQLRDMTGADLFEIVQKKPYADDYNTCIAQAKEDKQKGARPELESLPDLTGYDTVYLGYPNYWGTMPMAVFTLLGQYDWTGKTIRPFCTNEGSGMGNSERDLRREAPGAEIAAGLSIPGSRVEDAESYFKNWIPEA